MYCWLCCPSVFSGMDASSFIARFDVGWPFPPRRATSWCSWMSSSGTLDVNGSLRHCLLTLLERKNRYTAARHQLAKVDIPDLVEMVEIGFSSIRDFQKVWPMSGQTLRSRFKTLLSTLRLPIKDGPAGKPLTLGSLRPGGATWYLQTLEDGELVRRRRPWLTTKIMDVYIQEVAAIQYLRLIDPASLQRVMMYAKLFPTILSRARCFTERLFLAVLGPYFFVTPIWKAAVSHGMSG